MGARWTRLDKTRGIPANAPFFFAEDGNDFLWVGGLRGIYRVRITDLLAATGNPAARVPARTLLNERSDRHGGQKGATAATAPATAAASWPTTHCGCRRAMAWW